MELVHEIQRPTYIKDAPPRVFDTHVHYPFRDGMRNAMPIYSAEGMIDMLAYNCQRLNILRVCLLGRPDETNDLTLAAHRRYPGLFVPFAQVPLDEQTPELIDRYADAGYRGLKIINPRRNYDDPFYFPLYFKAQERGLVCLFHTGIVGGMVDYLQFPPRDNSAAQEMRRNFPGARGWNPEHGTDVTWYGAGRMLPVHLDGIGAAFPDLKVIGAHLGYGMYDAAAAIARWRPNVYFDISGGAVVRRHLIEKNMIGGEVSTKKLTWGSDCDLVHMSRELTGWMEAFARIGLSEQEQDDVFWGTAARLFGEEA